MATPDSDPLVPLSGDANIDVLVQGGQWTFAGPRVLTYAFEIESDFNPDIPWTDELKAVVADAFAAWEAVADVDFQEVPAGSDVDVSSADLAMALMGDFLGTQLNATALGFFPDPVAVDLILEDLFGAEGPAASPNAEGDIYLDNFQTPFLFLGAGGAGREVVLHEIGHALGLKHPQDDGLNARPTTTDPDERFTVMSKGSVDPPFDEGHAVTPLLHDILAIQYLYGANMSYHTGDDTYFLQLDGAQRAIWDAGGNDTLDASLLPFGLTFTIDDGVVMELTTRTQVAIAFNVTIENAAGTPFADVITGNSAANLLEGGAGADTLDGAGGGDTLAGGSGGDTYVLAPDAVVLEAQGGGADTAQADFSAVLPAHVETLKATGLDAISLTGNAAANTLLGNAADNTLDGGGGADTLNGGGGNDTYIFRGADTIVDSGGEDAALAQASLFSVPAGLENVTLAARAGVAWIGASSADNHFTGNDSANRIEGGGGRDLLEGARGDDTLLGGGGNDTLEGGRGADVMEGGAGNDLYVAGSVRDRIIETATGGVDTVEIAAPRFMLPSNVEDAFVTRDAGALVTGNALANVLAGGAGNDTFEGGGGADRFVFDELGGIDLILDFVHGVDKVVVEDAVFGTNITYEASTGALLYDGVQFATLGAGLEHPLFTGSDLQIV